MDNLVCHGIGIREPVGSGLTAYYFSDLGLQFPCLLTSDNIHLEVVLLFIITALLCALGFEDVGTFFSFMGVSLGQSQQFLITFADDC